MSLLEIPTRNDLPTYEEIVQLDGVNYTIQFYFNPRINDGVGKWFVSLADQNRKMIAGPVAVVASWPLFDRFIEEAVPPGMLFCWDTAGGNNDPGQFDLGDRCRLLYLGAET